MNSPAVAAPAAPLLYGGMGGAARVRCKLQAARPAPDTAQQNTVAPIAYRLGRAWQLFLLRRLAYKLCERKEGRVLSSSPLEYRYLEALVVSKLVCIFAVPRSPRRKEGGEKKKKVSRLLPPPLSTHPPQHKADLKSIWGMMTMCLIPRSLRAPAWCPANPGLACPGPPWPKHAPPGPHPGRTLDVVIRPPTIPLSGNVATLSSLPQCRPSPSVQLESPVLPLRAPFPSSRVTASYLFSSTIISSH